MSQSYIELYLKCSELFKEILMAEMADMGYDSFWENDEGFMAYISENAFSTEAVEALATKYPDAQVRFTWGVMAKKNWNEEWEKNFQPVWIPPGCYIRASFHPSRADATLELVIDPKMSFGTGHHPTTRLMLKNIMRFDLSNKKVMDAGCGTGILSIAAEKLGASSVYGFDLDDWAVENAHENLRLNNCKRCKIEKGSILTVFPPHDYYNVVFANINKHVLLEELPKYASYLPAGGSLFLSGFFDYDKHDLIEAAMKNFLQLVAEDTEEGWCMLKMERTYY